MSSRSLNKVLLIGNLTRDVELRYTAGGTPVATFTVATNRNYTDSTGKAVETAEYTMVTAWAKLAEICAQFLRKGSKVYIEGRLQTHSWEDKETAKTLKRTEVVANEMIVLSSSGMGPGNGNGAPASDDFSSYSGDMGEPVDMASLGDLGADTPAPDAPQAPASDQPSQDQSDTPF